MRRTAAAVIALALAVLLAGCSTVLPPSVPDRPADITGVITTIEKSGAGDVIGGMLVEDPRGTAKAFVSVTAGTKVLVQSGENVSIASFSDLAKADDVRVWFAGPVAESYPVQGTADTIVVTP